MGLADKSAAVEMAAGKDFNDDLAAILCGIEELQAYLPKDGWPAEVLLEIARAAQRCAWRSRRLLEHGAALAGPGHLPRSPLDFRRLTDPPPALPEYEP